MPQLSLCTLINGQPAVQVSVFDRGLSYGDGLFETLRIRTGEPEFWEAHWRRLREGCRRLRIPLADDFESQVRAELAALVRSTGQTEAVAKLLVTRGEGGRGYAPPASITPTRIVTLFPLPAYPAVNAEQGVRVRLCETRLARNPLLAGIKHLNRLEQVLARSEWSDPSIAEGLLRDTENQVIEGTMSNLFLVQGGRLITPDLEQAGVAGIMRAHILERYRQQGGSVEIRAVLEHDLVKADELFLTNSLIGIWPIRQLGTQSYQPGPITRMLQARLSEEHDLA